MYDPSDDKLDYEHEIRSINGLNQTEARLYSAMKSIGLKPIPQYKISHMTVDFAFPDDKLVIEVNGPYHQSPEQKERDKKRWFVLKKEGWSRKSFNSNRVYNDSQEVAYVIKKLLNQYSSADEEEERHNAILFNMWKRLCK